MDSILQQITDWLKEMLVSAIMGNLSGMFESVNNQVGEIATSVGMTPANFSPGVFAMVRNISESVIIPIAGLILTFIACYELIQMIIDHNNLANFETWIFFKWVFKTFVAVMLITNTFNITMAVFDVTQHVINASAGIISGNTAIDASALETMEETLMAMDLGPLLGLFLQSFIVQVTMSALAIIIFVIVYGRMIEIYLMVSLAPIPLSTFGNREQSNIGQNYLRSLFAIGFQGFLIMICVGIYAVLIQSIAFSDDIIGSKDGLQPIEKTVIDRCVHQIYQRYFDNPAPENMPILEDLYDALLKQDEKEAHHVATALEIYVKGSLKLFNNRTNVDIQNRLVCFDIKELGNQLKKIGMLIVQDQVWGRVTANRSAGKSTRYYIDEFHLLLKEEQTATYSVEIWKRFRKWGGLPTGITQNVKDLLRSPEIANILENSDFIYMLNQASDDRSILAQRLNISPHQLSYVTNSGEGEGLLFYGNVILPFIDRFPTDLELYRIMTTKLNEVAQEKEA